MSTSTTTSTSPPPPASPHLYHNLRPPSCRVHFLLRYFAFYFTYVNLLPLPWTVAMTTPREVRAGLERDG